MNTVKAEVNHAYFKEPWFRPFSASIENCAVTIDRTETPGNVILTISGRKGCDKLRSLFFEIYDLLFIYLGHFPSIISLEKNGENEDHKDWLNKYETSTLFGRLLPVCDVSEDTVNERALNNLRKLRRNPIFSLEYIVSKGYDGINITHRLLLLLHAMDGLVTQTQRASVEQDLKRITGTPQNKNDKKYKKVVFFICQEGFFNYHRKYKCEILSMLRLTKKTFLEKATDTRNVYSHFYIPVSPEAPIEAGSEMAFFFELLFFTTRIYLCKQLGLSPKEQNVKESFYRIHDWIAGNQKCPNIKYKSWAYALSSLSK